MEKIEGGNNRVFRRSATSFETLATASKRHVKGRLSYEEARAICQEFNSNRTPDQIRKGTKYEFESE